MISIKHRLTGAVLFEKDCDSLKFCMEAAVGAGANLHSAYLRGANLGSTHLAGANLRDAHLYSADLCGASLHDAHLRGADLRSADLRGAYLCNAELHGADLRGADLRGAHLRGADLCDANLSHADLSYADLYDTHLNGVDLDYTNLRDALLKDVRLNDDQQITITPLFIAGQRWNVMITDKHIKIGCQVLTTEQWRRLDDAGIYDLDEYVDEDTLKAWRIFKPSLLALAEAHQGQVKQE